MWPEHPHKAPLSCSGMFIKVVWGLAFFALLLFVSGERALVQGSRPAGWLSLAVGAVKTLQHTGEADVEQSDLVLSCSSSSTLGPLGLPRQ